MKIKIKNIIKGTIKTLDKTADMTVKTTKKIVKENIKATGRTRKFVVQAGKKTYQGVNLNIKVSSKSVEEMMTEYIFNSLQKEQVKELLSEEYANMWLPVIYGVSVGSPTIVEIALSQGG